jgi:hypothetical protein
MFRLKTPHLIFLAGLMIPLYSSAADYCIAVSNGFGGGGTSFVGPGFSVPAAGTCAPWAGFTKTATTVILMTSGTGCLSTNGKVLTVSVSSADPEYFGAGVIESDYIQFCLAGTTGGCPVTGSDQGEFSGPARPETCTTKLLTLPATHD